MIDERVSLRQRRDLGQIMQTSIIVYRQNFAKLIQIAALVIPLGIAAAILQERAGDSVFLTSLAGALLIGQSAVNLLASAALIIAVNEIDGGRAPDFAQAFDAATQRFWTLVWANLRLAFHVLLFIVTIVGIPWGIQRLVRWSFINQAVMLEGASAKESLSRSAEAVIGSWWRTLGIYGAIWLCAAVPAVFVYASFAFTPIAVSSSATAAIDALLLPFFTLAVTLLYFDLKARKESYDVSLA